MLLIGRTKYFNWGHYAVSAESAILTVGHALLGNRQLVVPMDTGNTQLTAYLKIDQCFLRSWKDFYSNSGTKDHILFKSQLGMSASRHCWGYYPGTLSCSHIGGTPHQPNYPLITALIGGSLHLFAQFPHSPQGTAQQGAEWVLIKAIDPLFSTAFEATFDKLQLIRTTLISKMIKS